MSLAGVPIPPAPDATGSLERRFRFQYAANYAFVQTPDLATAGRAGKLAQADQARALLPWGIPLIAP